MDTWKRRSKRPWNSAFKHYGLLISFPLCSAQSRLEAVDHTKTEPSFQALSVLSIVDLICHLWQQYVNIALLPLATSSVTIRREMVVFNNQTVSKIEGTANALMQRLTDGENHLILLVQDCFMCLPIRGTGGQRSSRGCRVSLQSRRRQTSNRGMMTCRLPASTRSPVSPAVKFWKKGEMQRRQT